MDFVCLSAALVIEIDGDSHEGREAYDHARQGYLEGLGFRVLRFAYDDVTRDLDLVVEAIARACGLCEDATNPLPASPEGGGDRLPDVSPNGHGVLPSRRKGQGEGGLGYRVPDGPLAALPERGGDRLPDVSPNGHGVLPSRREGQGEGALE